MRLPIQPQMLFAILLPLLHWDGYEMFSQTATANRNDSLHYEAKAGVVRTEFTDRDILAATYSDYRVPQGFYTDPAPDSVSVSYINSIGVWRKGSGAQVCTDNRDEAGRWQYMSDSGSSVHRKLLQESETDRYFEFKTEDPSPRHYILLMRIHKCSYIDRSNMNPPPHYGLDDFSGWFQGVFNIRPVTRKNVRYLAEYLWLIDHRATYGARVMSSFSHDKGKEITHTMYELRKGLEDQDFGRSVNRRPDPTRRRELAHVTLVRLDYHVNKKSGEILLDSKAIRTIDVRNNPPEILAK